jgi:hypothetical protein
MEFDAVRRSSISKHYQLIEVVFFIAVAVAYYRVRADVVESNY